MTVLLLPRSTVVAVHANIFQFGPFHFQIFDDLPPVCEVVSVKTHRCPEDMSQCESHQWELKANVTDGKGTGIKSISKLKGDGVLSHTSLSSPVVQANYTASCCSPSVEFVAVDKVGNEGKCSYTVVSSAGPPASVSFTLQLSVLQTF